MSNFAIVVIVLGLVICAGAWGWLQLSEKGLVQSNPTVDKVLKFAAIPLGILVTVLGFVALGKGLVGKKKVVHGGDNDLAPDVPEVDPNRETEASHVRRVIEETATRAEEHVLEEATDDEVAARGAALFDPGLPTMTDVLEDKDQ